MTTYGPYYPGNVTGDGWTNPDAAKQAGGEQASFLIGSEGVTPLFKATGFNADIPANAVVLQARMVVTSSIAQTGFNVAVGHVFPVGEECYTLPSAVFGEPDAPVSLTPAVVNNPAFGFDIAIYAQSGGLVNVDSLALYVDVA